MPSDIPAPVRPVPRRPRPRGGLLALALVLLVFMGAAVTALFSARGIEGAVPGRGGLLSVAATDAGFLVGTTTGAFASPDGRTWSRLEALAGPSPVAGDGDRMLATSGRELVAITDLRTVTPVATLPAVPTALAAGLPGSNMASDVPGFSPAVGASGSGAAVASHGSSGAVYAIDRSGGLVRMDVGGAAARIGKPGPESALALAVLDVSPPVIYAAGLGTGLWRSDDGGERWSRLLATPAQAILPDAGSPRILLGTPGGLLVTDDGGRSWRLSRLQVAVHGIARRGDRYYALTGERLLVVSPDGERDWRPLVPTTR